ncbi:cytochrome P450 89A2-like [Neltuma alba]|uniref:cytochrome P450 89A2-like n=1 Tax=Neltuma alba TaxID=207710 RepID=UPI0010A2CDE3|nr:cytochrome P450 89A2-like [Prosopis alba]
MEVWFIFIVLLSVSLCLLITLLFSLHSKTSRHPPLPPGPLRVPIIGSVVWLRRSFTELQPILRSLHAKHGPIVTLPIGSRPSVFISDRSLAHKALIQNGAVFSDRPKSLATSKVTNSNQRSVTSAFYGPTWRLLRRNLASEMLHASRIQSFSGTRKWVLHALLNRLRSDSESGKSIKVIDHLQYAMFCLLVFMCFGEKLDDKQINDIEYVQRRYLLNFDRFSVLNFWPRLTKILLHKRWEELLQIRKEQEDVLVPLIRARKKAKEENTNKPDAEVIVPYVDTLLDLQWPEEKRKLDEGEIVSLCSEFINAGTDTTSTALQWIMANLVKYSHVQQRVVEEIREVMRDREEKEVKEEDLSKLPYLKAVVLEGLRRHPPAHFVLPHAVSEDVVFNNYLVPKNGTVNFMVAEMGWDPNVWESPMEFKPERFLNSEKNGEAFDITGKKEIKMMPFGVGRRMCPGYNLAMLLLEYFVANLIWTFEWRTSNGAEVDLTEKEEFTVVMENPLQVSVSPRA